MINRPHLLRASKHGPITSSILESRLLDSLYEGRHGSSRRDSGLSLQVCGGCGMSSVGDERLVRF